MEKHLYDIFANKYYRGGTIYFYSDPHFGDEEMKYIRKNYIGDEEQIKRINRKVSRNDTIIFLGDIGNIECVRKIRGYKVLIMGNHDKGASNYKRVIKREPISDEKGVYLSTSHIVEDNHLFDEVYEGALMISNKIILSHEPIKDLPPFMFNIHGHDHSGWFDEGDGNHFNVCAEHIDYTPVSINDIVKVGKLKNVQDIHRIAIDHQIERKAEKGE